jgi:SAM-dependent methyltransferase
MIADLPPSPSSASAVAGPLLHVGCGRERLEGWVNIDSQDLPGVDRVADVTRGLPFEDCRAVFAEHFLEHLTIEQALDFLGEAHRALGPGGWLRLSTPNLEWVLRAVYEPRFSPQGRIRGALAVNRGFYAWGHRFLWDRCLLAEALAACGFTQVRWCTHGVSSVPYLHGLERHETYEDTPDLPHVLIVEATKGELQPERLQALRILVHQTFSAHLSLR